MDNYYENIFDAVKYNGKLYGMPISIGIDTLEANKELLDKYNINIKDEEWGWGEFEKAAEAFMGGRFTRHVCTDGNGWQYANILTDIKKLQQIRR